MTAQQRRGKFHLAGLQPRDDLQMLAAGDLHPVPAVAPGIIGVAAQPRLLLQRQQQVAVAGGGDQPLVEARVHLEQGDAGAVAPRLGQHLLMGAAHLGEPGGIERAVVVEQGSTPESLVEAAKDCGFRGERRSLRVPLVDPEWMLDGSVLTLAFNLPPGAYATSLLRELMKDG